MTDAPVKLSDWLEQFDSHTVYDDAVLDDCPLEGARDVVPVHTASQVARKMEQRGLGGHLHVDASDRLVTGYMMAEALGEKALGHVGSWGRYQGRGARLRAVIADLRDAGL